MDGRRTTKRHYSEYSDFFLTQREPEYDHDTDLQQRESTHVRWADRMEDASRILVWGTPRTTGRGGHMKITLTRTQSVSGRNSRRAMNHERWDILRKRALFTSDGTDSTTIGSNTPESHTDRPLEVKCSKGLITDKRQSAGGAERPCSSHIQLEMAVSHLQRDVEECSAEWELWETPAVSLRPVPRYSRKSNWEQYREVFEAIVCSNGWDDVTAALQLLSHLDGDALNIALLVPESRRVKPGFLIKSLSEHYNAPGRLAEYKRQFQRAVRRPGDDPSMFATELQTLARRAFIDIDLKIQSQMVRDRFIDGQAECALHRHLDSLGPNTPIPDIVDCWLKQCPTCMKRKSPAGRRHPLGNIPTGHRWDRIAMEILDVCDPTPDGYRYILVIADYFSKWTKTNAQIPWLMCW